jgi:Secreted repeat of unknown function
MAAAALVAAILGDTSSAASQKAPKGTLVSVHKTALGRVLVDARGNTLYLFEKDKNGMSSCNGAFVPLGFGKRAELFHCDLRELGDLLLERCPTPTWPA